MRMWILFLMVGIFSFSYALSRPIKLLHLGFHSGCINDFDDVGRELNIEVTNWIPLDQVHFQGRHLGNAIYNISRERGKEIWERHKDYFNQFDVIMTSDTARLSRIFLENGWTKPQIIWICNRFDYYDPVPPLFGIPDQDYYQTMREAISKSNVKIIAYTPYEIFYGHHRGVPFPHTCIKPVGHVPRAKANEYYSAIPHTITKSETLFVYPRLGNSVSYVEAELKKVGVPAYHGDYKGPEDLVDFKGVLYFPYQRSNLALFENIQQGIVHFVPSHKFMQQFGHGVRNVGGGHLELCEWYMQENQDLFVYFDSWHDLKSKWKSLNWAEKSAYIQKRAMQHRIEMLNRWKVVFSDIEMMLNQQVIS